MAGFYCKQVFPLVLGVSQTRAFSILGVTFQEDCRFTTHLRKKLIKANKCLFILRSLRKEGYTQTELDQLFQSLVIPNLIYGLSVYAAVNAELTTVQCFLGPVAKNMHLSAHLSRSLRNPLWVHLRMLHGTHLALSQVSVLRDNLRAQLGPVYMEVGDLRQVK